MRIVFVGAGEVAVMTARYLIDRGSNVIIIETDRAKIEQLSENLDCSFVQGDGSRPAILKEVNPKQTDVLFCLTDDDRVNLIASLVGRSLGFKRVIASIQDPEFENICRELGLEGTIIPSRTISRYLADIVRGLDVLELSTIIKGDARFYTFVARKEDEGKVGELELPDRAKIICTYHDGDFVLADDNTGIRQGDEVVVLTHSDNLAALKERWEPQVAESNADGK